MHTGGRDERHLVGRDHVLGAHLGRLAADGAGDLVDRALDRETGARPADAAIGTERRLVGRHRHIAGAVVLQRIGAGQGARRHIGFLIGPLRPQPIGAGIDDDLGLDAEDAALPVGIGGDLGVMIARMRRG